MSCPAVYMALGLMPVAYALFRWMFPVDQVDSSKCKDKNSKKIDHVMENILNRRTVSPKDCNGALITKQELDTMLEAGNWAPTHQKTEPWRYIVFSGSESIMTYLDYLDDYYNNCEELSETEAAKFRNKMSGARNTWVTNASAVIVIGMKRHAEKLPEWEEICAVAMSVQNMHLAAEAMGIGGFWSSHTWCKRARDSKVYREWLGLNGEEDRAFGAFVVGKVDPETRVKIKSARQPWQDKVTFRD